MKLVLNAENANLANTNVFVVTIGLPLPWLGSLALAQQSPGRHREDSLAMNCVRT
jgi:hypothetical protein